MRHDVGAYPVLRAVHADGRIAVCVHACVRACVRAAHSFAALRLAQVSRHERGESFPSSCRPAGCRVRCDRMASRHDAAADASVRLSARRRVKPRSEIDLLMTIAASPGEAVWRALVELLGVSALPASTRTCARWKRRSSCAATWRRGAVVSSGPTRAPLRRVAARRATRGHRRVAVRRSRSRDPVDEDPAARRCAARVARGRVVRAGARARLRRRAAGHRRAVATRVGLARRRIRGRACARIQ